MPIYEFRCSSCGHEFEDLIFKATDVEELICPKCGANEATRLMSPFSSNSGPINCDPSGST